MTNSKAMTKAEATRLARRTLAHGHFAHPEGARVRCPIPDRGEQHDVILFATAGRLPHGEMLRQLVDRILDCDLNQRADEDFRAADTVAVGDARGLDPRVLDAIAHGQEFESPDPVDEYLTARLPEGARATRVDGDEVVVLDPDRACARCGARPVEWPDSPRSTLCSGCAMREAMLAEPDPATDEGYGPRARND